ncbi:MAG: DUF3256 family protein [Muribaculaceae bacterium]|nr:DUF3256 family protein [Muribaculaceae bacterium]
MKEIIKKIVTIAVVMTAIVLPCNGAKVAKDTLTSRDVFLNLPLKTLDILDRSEKMDMLDYYDADSIYNAPNGMEGLSHLIKVTPDFLSVQLTKVTSMQILILPPGKGPAAMTLYTIDSDGEAADTEVSFFDSYFNELERKKYLQYPDILDFFNIPDKDVRNKIEDLVPFPTIEFQVVPGSTDLRAVLTVGEYMGKEDYDFIKKYMKESLLYRYDGKSYRLVK